jgi:hypothetical protein
MRLPIRVGAVAGPILFFALPHCGGRSGDACAPDDPGHAGEPSSGGSGADGPSAGGGSTTGATGGVTDGVLEYLDEADAAKNFAPAQREDGTVWCPVNLPDQTESVITLADRPEADGDTVRLGTDICGATTVAWEQEGRTRFERYFAEGGVPLSESNPPGLLADLTMSRTGAALLTTYDSSGGPSLFVLKPEELLEGPPAGTAWGSFPLVENSDGHWFDPIQRRDFVAIPSLEPVAAPEPVTTIGEPARYARTRASILGGAFAFALSAPLPVAGVPSRLDLYLVPLRTQGEIQNFSSALGWPVWAMISQAGNIVGSAKTTYGTTRRAFGEVVSGENLTQLKDWGFEAEVDCETSVAGYYPDSWRWVAPRCDLLVGLHNVGLGYLVIHYERRGDVWIPHLTLLSWDGREFATASLEDDVPELDPSGNLSWWEYGATVATSIHTASLEQNAPHRQRLTIGGMRADGGGLWVGRIRWWDFVQCPASSGDVGYDCESYDEF